MSVGIEIIEENKLPEVKQENAISLPDGMINDAFTALCLSILGEFFMSGTTKYFIFQGMLDNLEKKGYSKEDMNKFKEATQRIFDTYHKPNSFMG
jgi:hypothetical protein